MTEDQAATDEFDNFIRRRNREIKFRHQAANRKAVNGTAQKPPRAPAQKQWVWAVNRDAVYKAGISPHVTAASSKGAAGLQSIATLLVALEADNYVLTTDSNWSRLVDELRRSVIDSKCYNKRDASTCITRMLSVNNGQHDW